MSALIVRADTWADQKSVVVSLRHELTHAVLQGSRVANYTVTEAALSATLYEVGAEALQHISPGPGVSVKVLFDNVEDKLALS